MDNPNQINQEEEREDINIKGYNTSRAHYESPVAASKTND